MRYAHVKDNAIVKVSGRPNWYKDDGSLLTDPELIAEGVYPVEDEIPEYNPMTHRIERKSQEQWAIEADRVVITYDLIAYSEEEVKDNLRRHAAYCRWRKEVGGTLWNGWPVHTDRESQSKIIAERLAIEAGERSDPDGWKFADGQFRMVSNEDFMALASAVRQHVRDCFALEAAILAQIEAGTITEYGQIDAAFE